MDNECIIKVSNLDYDTIFHDFNLDIKRGSFITISGSSGCGKTTLIKLLSGIISTKDSIYYDNERLEEINKNKIYNDIASIYFDREIVFKYHTVEEELFSVLENINLSQTAKIIKYQEVIERFELDDLLVLDPNSLGLFDRMKVVITMCLLSSPKVLLIDDINLYLDKFHSDEIIKILDEFRRDEKVTVIITTNDLNNAIYSDLIYLMKNGEIVLNGSPMEVLRQDNIINKIGLSLPFMYDLSVKLQDYQLVDEVETDMQRMVDKLWK